MNGIVEGGIIFIVAFMVTYVSVPFSKWIAVKIGAIDYPSNRRMNTEPIPRCGGIALYLGLMAAAITMYVGMNFFDWEATDLYVVKGIDNVLLILGITIMFLVGLIDDVESMNPWLKLAGQFVSAIILCYAGATIDAVRSIVDSSYVSLDWLNYPLTVVYLVAFVNIINLIDGLDGLAAGIVTIVSLSLLYLVVARGSFTLAVICIALAATCLAFLRYNFYPASVFMGDSGSLLLGVVVGIVSISGVIRTQSLVAMLVPIVIAGVPVIDTLSAIVRRRRVHQPVEKADLGHIHHRLVRAGFGQRKSVLILYACSAALAIIGCVLGSFSGPIRWAVFAALALVVGIVIMRFGLFKPVLQHYYDNRNHRGRRAPRTDDDK